MSGDVAFGLMANSFVTLFRRPAVLDETVDWLTARGYQVVRVDAAGWTTQADLHRDIAAALGFPGYGRNLDALNDCLGDVARYEYGTSPDATGLVLVLTGYDAFAARHPEPAHALLDIFADQARTGALFGHRMLCLVQSGDPDIVIPAVGAMPVMWNPAEALYANRRGPLA